VAWITAAWAGADGVLVELQAHRGAGHLQADASSVFASEADAAVGGHLGDHALDELQLGRLQLGRLQRAEVEPWREVDIQEILDAML
jgi:hypothetical protein